MLLIPSKFLPKIPKSIKIILLPFVIAYLFLWVWMVTKQTSDWHAGYSGQLVKKGKFRWVVKHYTDGCYFIIKDTTGKEQMRFIYACVPFECPIGSQITKKAGAYFEPVICK
jgi:hypothetical protein